MNLFEITEGKTNKKKSINEGFEIVYEFVKEDYASLGTGGGAGVANGGGGAAGTTSPENNTSVIGSGADNLTEFDPNEYSERYTVYRNREKIQSFPDLDQATEYIDDWLSVEDTGYADVWEIVDVDGKTVWEQDPHDYGNANKITIGGKGVGGMLGGVGESLDEDDQWHSGTSDQWHGATSDEWHGTGMQEADTAERLKRNLKKNGFDMDSFDAKIAEIERRNRELADEFYARHPELDDRVKDESATMFTSIGSDAGAGIGAATLGTDNNISPVGSGTVDEGYEDEVGFGVNSDQAYRAVMAKFGDYIEHRDDGIMYAPRELWSAIEQTAFDADGVGAEEDAGPDMAEDQNAGGGGQPPGDSTSPVGGVAEGWNEFTPDNGGEITERINQKSIQAGFKDHQKVMGGKFDLYADSDGRTLTVKLHDPNADFWEAAAWARFEVKGLFFMKNLQSLKTWVEPQYRRMGLATTIYQYVQNLGNTIKPAVVRTDMGKAMWKGFKSKGVAEGDPKTYTRGDPRPDQEFYFPVKDQWPEKLGPMGKPRKRKDVDVSEDIAEDVYESRLYRMKLAGYDIK